MFDAEPGMRRALLATLAREIRRLSAQVQDLHFLDLPGRLANHLVRFATPASGAAIATAGEQRLAWPYTQGELAGMIGASRQSVNRLLSEFVADGLVRFEGDELVIPDVARLRRRGTPMTTSDDPAAADDDDDGTIPSRADASTTRPERPIRPKRPPQRPRRRPSRRWSRWPRASSRHPR